MRQIHVIINPVSGRPQPILSTLNAVFREAKVKWDVSITHESGDARRAASTAAAQGVDVVAVYGGDGTVLEAATGLLGTTTPMAILPGGTANVLSVELGIPHDLAAATRIAGSEDSPVRKVDMGQSGERGGAIFADTDEVGLYTAQGKDFTYPFAANLANAGVSDITPHRSLTILDNPTAAQGRRVENNFPLLPLLAFLALTVLVVEWWAFHRRVYVN